MIDRLTDLCDVEIGGHSSADRMLPEAEDLVLVARESSGGALYAWGEGPVDRRPIVVLSSYGETSRFAADLREAVAIVIAFPSWWTDVLVAAHKSEALVHTVVAQGEQGLGDDERTERGLLRAMLGLHGIDPIAALLAAVRTEPGFRPMIETRDGTKPAGSFGERPFPK